MIITEYYYKISMTWDKLENMEQFYEGIILQMRDTKI